MDGALYNTAVGDSSMSALTTGDYNVAVGRASAHSLTEGTQNVLLGYGAVTDDATATNQVVLGYEATGVADNSVTLGNGNVTAVYMSSDSGARVHAGALTISDTAISTTTSYTGISATHTKTAGTTDIGDSMFGISNTFTFSDADTAFNNFFGIYNVAHSALSAGESGDMYGVYTEAKMAGSTDVENIYGSNIVTNVDAGTVDAKVYGQYTSVDISGGTIADIIANVINVNTAVDPGGDTMGLKIAMAGSGMHASTDYFMYFLDGVNTDVVAQITAVAGVATFDSGDFSGAPDYAEYFESKSGSAIAIGSTVKLDGDKIVACSDGDTPIGVVRPKWSSSVVCGSAPTRWAGKYLKDDYDEVQMEDYTMKKWIVDVDFDEYIKRGKTEEEQKQYSKVDGSDAIEAKDAVLDDDGNELAPAVEAVAAVPDKYYREHCYHSDRIPDGITAPDDAETLTPSHQRKKLNPDYDPSKDYVKRADRDEWCLIGLLGQIPITKGQPTGSWIKMKDVSDTVEMYFVK